MPTVLTPKFILAFDMATNTMSITDASTSWSATCAATVRITHETSGTIIYNGSGWHATTPTWSTPPIADDTITIEDIDLPTLPAGTYKVEYWTRTAAGATPVLTTRRFTLDYVSPEVEIDYTISCSQSTLTSDIATDFTTVIGGVSVEPTVVYEHTIVAPAGATYTGTLGTTADKTRTIGGGSTDGTRLWTRDWQIVAVANLAFHVSDWSATTAQVELTDIVSGNDEAFVQCDAVICALRQCYANLFDRWVAALTTNFAYAEAKYRTVMQVMGLFIKLEWYERCGQDTEQIILDLQTALSGENCNCTSSTDAASQPVVPWSALTGSGTTVTISPIHIETTNPTSPDGANGDMWFNTTSGDVFKKTAGTWLLMGNMKGATGADGSATQKTTTLVSDITTRATPASTTPTAISYSMALNNDYFAWDGDSVTFDYIVKLAQNDNTKTIALLYDGNTLLSYTTDDLVRSDNDDLAIHARITRKTNINQHITAWGERGGVLIGPVYHRDYSMDLSTDKAVVLYGTNGSSSAADITGYQTDIKQWMRETTLIPGGSASGGAILSQTFTATEGQTEFTVTDFVATDYYIALIDDVPQSNLVVTRSGQVFTYAPGLGEGQKLNIIRTYIES